MSLFLFVITIFWFIYILERALFWIYLWQLKEYRFDRVRAHFELPSGQALLFNTLVFAKVIFLLSALLFFVPIFELWKIAYVPIGSIFYLLLGGYVCTKAISRNVKIPVFTPKAILLSLLVISAAPFSFAALFLRIFEYEYQWFIVSIASFDVLIPLLVALAIGAIKPFTLYFKRQIIAQAIRKRKNREGNLLVIGVTGSYGKTTTKEFLAHVLSHKFKVLKTDLHNNTEIAVARTILNTLNDSHEIFVVEMGAYRRGEIKLLCGIVEPQIGILTGIGDQHLSLFGSQENIIKAKYELIESLPKTGLAVFNGDNKYCAVLSYKTHKPKRMYGAAKEDVDLRVTGVAQSEKGITWSLSNPEGRSLKFNAPIVGKHYAQNLTAAALVALELGMTPAEIEHAFTTIKPFPHTMEVKKGIKDLKIIDDSYSANLDGVLSALETLADLPGNKVIVMPSLIELGKNAPEDHKRIAERIAQVCKTAVITTPDYFNIMQQVVLERGMTEIDFVHMQDPGKIVDKIKSTCREGDWVLLESRVPQKLLDLLIAS